DSQASFAPTAPRIGWLDPRQIALNLSAGALAGLLDLGVLLSLAALIFSGPLAGFVANGIGLVLVGSCAMNIVLALLSSRPGIVGTTQDAPAVVVALIAANIAAAVPAATGGAATHPPGLPPHPPPTLATPATLLPPRPVP